MSKSKIVLVEDHHQALDEWQRRKIKKAPLVHLDAHIDFGFYPTLPAAQAFAQAKNIADLKRQLERSLLFERYQKNLASQLNIANYIYPAMRDGIVESFHWIVPGGREEFRKSMKVLKRSLGQIQSKDPMKKAPTTFTKKSLRSRLYDKEFLVTDIFSVKTVARPVLLDIDVDYLLFDSVNKASPTEAIGRRRPWIYPDKLVDILKKKFPRRLCVTVAYSVNGGYTSIGYKFFGDEIARRLERGSFGRGLENIFALRNAGLKSYFRKDIPASFGSFKQAAAVLAKQKDLDAPFRRKFLAHLYFWLFTLNWTEKRFETARSYYRQALQNDPALRVADNNYGWLYLKKDQLGRARAEFAKIIFCDPLDAVAHRGLGDVFFRLKKLPEARDEYKKTIRIDRNDKKALLGYARSCLLLKDHRGAKISAARLMKLDPLSGPAYEIQAELSAKKGDLAKALALYKKAAVLGPDSPDKYKDIFRILKIKKDAELADFFRRRYKALKKR